MDDEKKASWFSPAGFVFLLVGMLVFYVLAIGPLEWLDNRGVFSNSTREVLMVLYFPVRWLVENSDAFAGWILWYAELFR